MAKKPVGVWGVDLGQSALKALRCRKENGKIVADAFDFVEYPKILSQPEAEPEVMIRECLKHFFLETILRETELRFRYPVRAA